MGDWSQLPSELLHLISHHIDSEIDLLRYRSVCTSWRSSVLPTSSPAPILPNEGISSNTWGFYFSKRTVYRLSLPIPTPHSPWLIKLDRLSPHRLINPLSSSPLNPCPPSIDSSQFRINELCHEYTLQYINYRPFASSIAHAGDVYMEKVACYTHGNKQFVLLTIHVSGKLAVFKSGDKKWSVIDELPSPYDDVAVYDKKFYAVDNTGRTVMVDVKKSSTCVNMVGESVFGGDKKILVESSGELFLVDKYLSVGPDDDDEGFEFYEEFDSYTSERTVRFEVFKLDRGEKKWVEVSDLGDRMFFLGDNCTFSASALDFPGCKGNCLFFTDPLEDGGLKGRGIGVFDLETGSIGPLANNPAYSDVFWPPPSWVSSSETALEVGLNQLSI